MKPGPIDMELGLIGVESDFRLEKCFLIWIPPPQA